MKIKKEVTINVKLSKEELDLCIRIAAIITKADINRTIQGDSYSSLTLRNELVDELSTATAKVYSLYHILDEKYDKLNIVIQDK